MEYPIKNISIEQIRRAVHDVKGIDNDLLIDHTEYYISGRIPASINTLCGWTAC